MNKKKETLSVTQDEIWEMAALVADIKNNFLWIRTECCEGSEDIDTYMGRIERSVDELADILEVQPIVCKNWDYDRDRTVSETLYDSPLCNEEFSKVVDNRVCHQRLFDEIGMDAILRCNECDLKPHIGKCTKEKGINEPKKEDEQFDYTHADIPQKDFSPLTPPKKGGEQ